MSAMQRSKGQRGERELFGLLSDQLGFIVQRNIDQARAGGADCIQVPGCHWNVSGVKLLISTHGGNKLLNRLRI